MSTNTAPTSTTAWHTWQDWVNLVLGVFFALTPTFFTYPSGSAWAVVLGIVVAGVALWALATRASAASEWVQIVAGVVTFLSPWFGGFASGAAGWTGWIVGIVVTVLAIWALNQYKDEG